MRRQYFYDKQIKRYIQQLVRLFSGFEVYSPKRDKNTNALIDAYRQIPCVWGDISRMGATWLNANSENISLSAPMFTLSINSLTPSPDYRLSPFHQEDTVFTKKQVDENGNYINKPASTYKVSQHMPVPYTMEISLNILVTSTDQKLEIIEQIISLFNPGFRMQSNSSPFDIGKYFNISLGTIEWSSRSYPQGSSVELDVATLTFTVEPVYINVPSKIRRNTLIKRIYTNINVNSPNGDIETTLDEIIKNDNRVLESIVVTPGDYKFKIDKKDGEYYGAVLNPSGDKVKWEEVFEAYGRSEENDTWIRVRRTEDVDDDNFDIYMTFNYTNDPYSIHLNFDEDTFKATDIEGVDKIINPNKKSPATFGDSLGTRYLITTDITNPEWGISAPAMSVIERDESGWILSFDPSKDNTEHYVINMNTDDQYYYDGQQWLHYIVGTYEPSFWMFDVQTVNCIKKGE